jgi:hypothetical protein
MEESSRIFMEGLRYAISIVGVPVRDSKLLLSEQKSRVTALASLLFIRHYEYSLPPPRCAYCVLTEKCLFLVRFRALNTS